MIRRINLYGQPNSGKSTLAAHIYAMLKERQYNVELCREAAKDFAYRKQQISSWYQHVVFGQQLHEEFKLLDNGVKLVISDSPLMLNVAYGCVYDRPAWYELLEITRTYEREFPGIHILCKRDPSWTYQQDGRFENEEESKKLENKLIPFVRGEVGLLEFDNIYDTIHYIESMVHR